VTQAQDELDTQPGRDVSALSEAFAKGIKVVAAAPALRDGLLGGALSDLIWTLYFEFPHSRDTLHTELAALGMAVQSSAREGDAKALQTHG
jgi:hypothetical protein